MDLYCTSAATSEPRESSPGDSCCSTCNGTGEIPARGHEAVAAGIATWPCPQCSDADEDLPY